MIYRVSQKLYLIVRLDIGAVLFSMTKIVHPDSRDIHIMGT